METALWILGLAIIAFVVLRLALRRCFPKDTR